MRRIYWNSEMDIYFHEWDLNKIYKYYSIFIYWMNIHQYPQCTYNAAPMVAWKITEILWEIFHRNDNLSANLLSALGTLSLLLIIFYNLQMLQTEFTWSLHKLGRIS